MTTPLETLAACAADFAHHWLLKKRAKQLTPMYLLFYPDTGEDHGTGMTVVECRWTDETEKLMARAAVRAKAHELGATTLAFLTEAWMAKRPVERPAWDLPPSQDPHRIEVVIVVATDGRETITKTWQIERNKRGNISRLVVHPLTGATSLGGRMIDGILPTGRVH